MAGLYGPSPGRGVVALPSKLSGAVVALVHARFILTHWDQGHSVRVTLRLLLPQPDAAARRRYLPPRWSRERCSAGTESFLGWDRMKSVSRQDAGLVLAVLQLKGDPPCREGVKEEITP